MRNLILSSRRPRRNEPSNSLRASVVRPLRSLPERKKSVSAVSRSRDGNVSQRLSRRGATENVRKEMRSASVMQEKLRSAKSVKGKSSRTSWHASERRKESDKRSLI